MNVSPYSEASPAARGLAAADGPAAVADAARPDPAAILDAAAATLEEAAADPQRATRLAVVGTTVAFDVRDLPGDPLVVRLGPDAVAVDDAGGPAEIRLELDAVDVHEMFAGGLHLPMKIAAGRVGYEGPVRRFLRVAPVVAGLRTVYAGHLAAARQGAA